MSSIAELKYQYLFLVEFDSKICVCHEKFGLQSQPGLDIPAKVVVAQFVLLPNYALGNGSRPSAVTVTQHMTVTGSPM